MERGSEAEALSRPRVADIAYVRMTNGSFGYVAFVAGVFARGTVGRVCATAMDARGCHCRRRNGRLRGPHRMAAQTLPGFEGPGAGDVPVGLVVELEAAASVIGYGTPEEVETEYYANQAAQAVVTIRAKQKSGHINPPISVRKRMSGPCINARSTTPTFDDNHGPATLSLLFPPSSRTLLPAAHKNVTLERHVRVRPAQLREFRIVNGTRYHEPR